MKAYNNGETHYNVYDSSGQRAHTERHLANGQVHTKTDYRAAGMRISRFLKIYDHLGDLAGYNTVYYHSDHLGSPVLATNVNGTERWRESYTPFGETLTSPADNDNQPGFTGHIKDSATGLTYMQARFYDPVMGRFLSVDPVTFMMTGDPNFFNRYTYAFNDPVNLLDPTGMATCADQNCDTSTIDNTITRGAPPVDSSLAGNPNADSASVSFVNDNPNNPSPNQPVATHTAQAVEGAIRDSNVSSVNINSTTGGNRTGGNHPLGQAVDINEVNGQSVLSQGASPAVTSLQDSFAQQPTARENFGPSQNTVSTRTYSNVAATTRQAVTGIVSAHRNHVHLASHAMPTRALPVPRIKP